MSDPILKAKLDDHEGRIFSLEAQQQQQEKQSAELKAQVTGVENTVLKSSERQQEQMNLVLNHLINNDVHARQDQRESRKEEYKRLRYRQKQIWKIVGLLAGSGGLLYLLLESFIST